MREKNKYRKILREKRDGTFLLFSLLFNFPENQTKIHSEKNRDSKEKLENKIGERRSTRRNTVRIA
jgi:hypothetical protein